MKKRGDHGGNIYQSGIDLDKVIDLSSNINPMPIPQNIYESLPKILDLAKNYPDIEYSFLREAVSKYLNGLTKTEFINKEMITLGNGATELLEATISTFKSILIPIPSFYEYERAAAKNNLRIIFFKKYNAQGGRYYEEMSKLISVEKPESVILCNPNNPDGVKLDVDKLMELINKYKDVFFIIDETFGEYLDEDDMVLPRINEVKNVVVIKALTKFFGLPGCRLGYMVTSNLDFNNKVASKLPIWNINTFSEQIAILMFKENEYIEKSKEMNRINREYLMEKLEKIGVFDKVYDSSSDFLMVKSDDMESIVDSLKEKQILIRSLKNMRALDETYARIAVKTKDKTDRLIEELKVIKQSR